MAVLPIVITGDPVLHSAALPVEEIDESLATLVHDMEDTMSAAPGVGLAAPQVGVSLRLFVYNWRDGNGYGLLTSSGTGKSAESAYAQAIGP